ncbi:MAG TPA: BatD family protein [Ferruginibacter sp.]|nr:BatD family protein [Ferruginibacter sp.]HMP20706.1 BatD family protein [Ferruginibacter sp.]
MQAAAQPKLTATVNPKVVGKDELFEYRLVIENAGSIEKISLPGLSRFSLVSGPSQESRTENINGVQRRYSSIAYILKPVAAGNVTIAAAEAIADGKKITSNSITITVTNQPKGTKQSLPAWSGAFPFEEPEPSPQLSEWVLKKGESIQDKINRNIFIRAGADKTTCYVGEPLVVTYKLYTRLKSESNIVKNPSFNGFSVIDLLPPGSITPMQETINGRTYNVYLLRKAQLYPLQAGEAELETAAVENTIQFVKQEYLERQKRYDDYFDDFFQPSLPKEAFVHEQITLQSKPVFITVKPLPDAGKPEDFSGTVGQFFMEAFVQKTTCTTDDVNRLSLKISGSGNIGLITSPDIVWPGHIEAYEPVVKEVLNKANSPVTGEKIFEYPFTVSTEGKHTIPPLGFTYFDAAAGKYKTTYTTAITITVEKGKGITASTSNAESEKNTTATFFSHLHRGHWLIITAIALVLITGAGLWIQQAKKNNRRKKTEPKENTPLTANPVISQHPAIPFAEARQKMEAQDIKGFYTALHKELKILLSGKLDIAANADRKTTLEALDKYDITQSAKLEWQHLLDEIEWQLYTPLADASLISVHYEKAVLLAGQLQKMH